MKKSFVLLSPFDKSFFVPAKSEVIVSLNPTIIRSNSLSLSSCF